MRPKPRAAGDRTRFLVRLVSASFFLGVVALFSVANVSFVSNVFHSSGHEALSRRGEYSSFSRQLLDPGTGAALRDLHELHQQDGNSFIAGLQPEDRIGAQGQPTAAGERRGQTLVVYVYNAGDLEHQKNFDFFLKWGIAANDGVNYKIIITQGKDVLDLLTLPQLPPNAEFLKTSSCTSLWGAIASVMHQLPISSFEYFVVVDSSVKGPFIPVYAQQVLHWTEAFTSKLTGRVKLVGSAISCEGSPKAGNAAGEWRLNPYVMPYAWAIDKTGWELLVKDGTVFKCYDNPWDTRYYGDSGASLLVLKAGHNLDTLLTRYQGVDWWSQNTWGCNERMRPDGEMYYDGVSITPYETVFVPVSLGYQQNGWSFVKTAAKYEEWLNAQAAGAPKVVENVWVSDAMTMKAQQLVYMNARGPGCFDFRFYLQHNPDLSHLTGDPLQVWEHFLLLGQFQGRLHRFSCPVQIGNSYRVAYVKARGHACFDHNYYLTMAPDLAVLPTAHDLWLHYAGFGQFENRANRYTCADTFRNLISGFEEQPVKGADPQPAAGQQQAAEEGASNDEH